MDAYVDKTMPAEGVPDDIKDVPPVDMLFHVKGTATSMSKWQVESDTVVDAVQLVCAQFQERLNNSILTLRKVYGNLAHPPTTSWHLQIADGASQDDVLKIGQGSRLGHKSEPTLLDSSP